jgi:hypothetical protein
MAFHKTIAIPDADQSGKAGNWALATGNWVPATDLVTCVTSAEGFRCGIKISRIL